MSLLEHITSPGDLQAFSDEQLQTLCGELRETVIETVSRNGGHLSSNLGTVELTVALHRAFSFPKDRIVWDVGHQCYAHKLLTGRFATFKSLRKTDGISGFPKPSESEYDTFIAGHSSTSISAANGLAAAKKLKGEDGYVIAVIGDGAMTGGLAYEGLCNAGRGSDKLIVVLNDNGMSINENVGFMARHLSSLRARPRYVRFKHTLGRAVSYIPLIGKPIFRLLERTKRSVKRTVYHKSCIFEEMGFYYLGPVDGHDLDELRPALEAAKAIDRPVLLHVVTVKGKGCDYAMANPDVYHGVSGFDAATGKTPAGGDSFSKAFGDCMCELAKTDANIYAITAAMREGTGLTKFASQYPNRFFDVGIAEEHAVTFASGLATGGCLPVFAVYSTFLQRAYDQILNDTAIMNNHIVLAVDRAGIVPGDGETHQGIFDVPFLSTIPNVTVFSPSTYGDLAIQLKEALYHTPGIAVVRYPRGGESLPTATYKPTRKPFTHFRNTDARTLVITYGRLFSNVLQAVSQLREEQPLSVLKLNRIYPIPEEALRIAAEYRRVVFFEEGSKAGGIGERFGALLAQQQYWGEYEAHAIEQWIPNCSVEDGLRMAGLDVNGMITVLQNGEGVEE